MIKIVLVEDREETQDLMQGVFAMNKNIKLVGAFSDGKSALKNIPLLQPDIVMMDIGLPDISGIECIAKLCEDNTRAKFMICSCFGDEEHIFNALEAGATSYLLKSSKPRFILDSIDELYKGGSPMSADIATVILKKFFSRPKNNQQDFKLTSKEMEILTYLSKGLLYKEVSDILNISINTIKVHCYNIYQKLHVNNKVEAINIVFGKKENL